MNILTRLYYHTMSALFVFVLCAGAFSHEVRSEGRAQQNKVKHTKVVKKKQYQRLLYLTFHGLVGCKTREDATKLAAVYADVGTDPVRSGFAYEQFWNNKQCSNL